jgi:hypothetical protein
MCFSAHQPPIKHHQQDKIKGLQRLAETRIYPIKVELLVQ